MVGAFERTTTSSSLAVLLPSLTASNIEICRSFSNSAAKKGTMSAESSPILLSRASISAERSLTSSCASTLPDRMMPYAADSVDIAFARSDMDDRVFHFSESNLLASATTSAERSRTSASGMGSARNVLQIASIPRPVVRLKPAAKWRSIFCKKLGTHFCIARSPSWLATPLRKALP